MMGSDRGAFVHELCSASVHPTLRGARRESARALDINPRWDVLLKLGVVKDALRVALDGDGEASVDELLGGRGGESRAVLELLGLAAEPEL